MMKKSLKRMLGMVCLLCLLLTVNGLAMTEEQPSLAGCWQYSSGQESEAFYLDIHTGGLMESYREDGTLLWAGMMEAADGKVCLYTPTRQFYCRFDNEVSQNWMNLTDLTTRELTVWTNLADPQADDGLYSKNRQEVGYWSQVAEGQDIPVLELYDDSVYAYAPSLAESDSGEVGLYSLRGGLLELCGEMSEPIKVAVAQEKMTWGGAEYTRVSKLDFLPTQQDLLGQWSNEIGELVFEGDGTASLSALTTGTVSYDLLGGRLFLTYEPSGMQPGGVMPVTLRLTDEGLVLTYQNGTRHETVYRRVK